MRATLALLLLVATPLAAQTGSHAAGAIREVGMSTIGYITTTAEEMPEAKYAFRPVAGVRSFGELIGHIAGTQHLLCAAILGEPVPAEDAVEKSATTKAALVAALKESTAHCAKAHTISDAAGNEEISVFGQRHTKLWALTMNAVHNGEHYGNIVTYLRMNGMVPPSSRGQ